MGASHRQEALGLLDLVRRGVDTPASILALVRVPERQRRFLDACALRERELVEAEFLKLLREGNAPPPPVQPIQQAILEALTELMAAPPAVQIPHAPRPLRGPYRKRIPPEDFASATIGVIARHFGVKVQDLMKPTRGPSKGAGVPRWTAVLLLRNGGVRMREIVDVLGYTDPSGAYAGLNYLHAIRARDPQLDRDISLLLERMRAEHPAPEPDAVARPQSNDISARARMDAG